MPEISASAVSPESIRPNPTGLEPTTLLQHNSPEPVMEHVGGARHWFDGKAPPAARTVPALDRGLDRAGGPREGLRKIRLAAATAARAAMTAP